MRSPGETFGGHRLLESEGDGFTDLVTHHATQASGIAAGDAEACLRGDIGVPPFEACAAIRTVGR